jgi:hypothetical protein
MSPEQGRQSWGLAQWSAALGIVVSIITILTFLGINISRDDDGGSGSNTSRTLADWAGDASSACGESIPELDRNARALTSRPGNLELLKESFNIKNRLHSDLRAIESPTNEAERGRVDAALDKLSASLRTFGAALAAAEAGDVAGYESLRVEAGSSEQTSFTELAALGATGCGAIAGG